MQIKLTLDVNDVNTVLEGLARVQENAGRVQNEVRTQASVQFEAQQKAAEQAAKEGAAKNETGPAQD